MVVGLPPLEFTECMNDSPYFRENLHKHEKELENTSQQIKRLIKEVKDLILAAKQLSHAQRTFSKSLQGFSFECIGNSQTDDEVVISSSLREFGRLIAAIEEERDRMLRTAYDNVVVPLELFRKKHIGGVKEGKKKFDKQTAKFCQSQERYLNLSTKKQDNVLQEADASLDMAERHFYQASMEYVFLLQEVQERKKFEFVETLLMFMFGWLTFYHQGHEVAEDHRKYMQDLQLKLQKTRENFEETRNQTESLKKKMLEVRQQTLDDPARASKGCATKEGYLFLQEKKAFGYQWVKHYCTYDKSTKEFTMLAYNQLTTKVVSTPDKLVLTSCVRRMSESIEKRFCFDIQVEDRPGVVYTFQALNEDDRKAWMDIMDGKEPTYTHAGKVASSEERVLDEVGIAFVDRCIRVLESRGLEEQGLYRTGGVTSKVNKLLSMGLDRRKAEREKLLAALDDPLEWESKTITSALKSYLRTLPEPLMTYRYHSGFIAAAKQETRQMRINDVHTLVHRLPKQNFEVLDILIKHLKKVADKSDKNLMPIGNLGVCFGPTLLRPEEETVASIMDLKFNNLVVEILVENYEKIFKSKPEPDLSISDVSPRQSTNTNNSSPVTQTNTVTVNNHMRSSTPPLNTVRHVGVTHPQPRYSAYHGNQPLCAVIKYQDGPTPVNMSSSLHNVTGMHERESNGGSVYGLMSRSELGGRELTSPHGSHQQLLGNHRSSAVHRIGITTHSEGNLHNMHGYSTHPSKYKPNVVTERIYGMRNDISNSTSSSNESVSSVTEGMINHNHSGSHYAFSPEKTKRANPVHYAAAYRSQQGNIRVRTLYACVGEHDGELSFEPNQIITNVRKSQEPGWLEGTLNGKTGLVPENYVEQLP